MTTALLTTTYFGPIVWYQALCQHDQVLLETHESYQKQTYRNRCHIATAQGLQPLTVPVVHEAHAPITAVRISDHGNWRHLHWQAITSAYGLSPFLEYYEDDLRPFFFEPQSEYLLQFNEAIRLTLCRLLDISPRVEPTTTYLPQAQWAAQLAPAAVADLRTAIGPHQQPAAPARPYYQVFAHRRGFLPHLSVLDLLLNQGPEAIFWLR